MRFDRDHLVWKALVAIDEAIVASQRGVVERTWSLRFALAYLYAVGDGPREHFETLWRLLGDPVDRAPGKAMADHMRSTGARTEFYGIARGVGHNPAGDLCLRLAEARRSGDVGRASE